MTSILSIYCMKGVKILYLLLDIFNENCYIIDIMIKDGLGRYLEEDRNERRLLVHKGEVGIDVSDWVFYIKAIMGGDNPYKYRSDADLKPLVFSLENKKLSDPASIQSVVSLLLCGQSFPACVSLINQSWCSVSIFYSKFKFLKINILGKQLLQFCLKIISHFIFMLISFFSFCSTVFLHSVFWHMEYLPDEKRYLFQESIGSERERRCAYGIVQDCVTSTLGKNIIGGFRI